jgi:15-cis-phytoene synthase
MNSPENSTPVHDLRECRKLMRGGSKTFFAASLLLPARVREPASALYAFCRLADDAIDLGDDPAAAMTELRGRLDAVYAGRPGPVPADRALARVVHRHGVPRLLLDALLEGFVWDASGRRYESIEEVWRCS